MRSSFWFRRATAVAGVAAVWACTNHTGPAYSTLAVLTSTTGASLDPDGYTLTIARQGTGALYHLRPNGEVNIARAKGTDALDFSGLSSNCTQTTHPPTTIAVPGDQEVDTLRYAVNCAHASGAIALRTDSADSLGGGPFAVQLDGAVRRTLSAHDSTLFSDLADGVHALTLTPKGAVHKTNGCLTSKDSVGVSVSNSGTTALTLSLQIDCCSARGGCD
jgi:hypothetical protein